ncbi:hypothetical protein LTR37_015168 [Vermiconidia calcicola]|uniref:Uncharacterized protein n=1 Tax=Vermiconidia calcicola TaxID=1690605 RepID=A0ACC3MRH0_9PEZI|nr:hypothetical protein LTR37_015168 [Vermiconidia calcicola]
MSSINHEQAFAEVAKIQYRKITAETYACALASDLLDSRSCTANFQQSQRTHGHKDWCSTRLERITARLKRFDAVARRVFETYELLEMILLYLPVRTLLLVQRVNRIFKAVTERSLSLRRALFLVPGAQSRGDLPLHHETTANHWIREEDIPNTGPWKFIYLRELRYLDDPLGPRYNLEFAYLLSDDFCSRFKPLAQIHAPFAHGSWRNMLPTLPSYDGVYAELYCSQEKRSLARALVGTGAVTMGQVQEMLGKLYTKTLASDDWRNYVDGFTTFNKNVDTVVP